MELNVSNGSVQAAESLNALIIIIIILLRMGGSVQYYNTILYLLDKTPSSLEKRGVIVRKVKTSPKNMPVSALNPPM